MLDWIVDLLGRYLSGWLGYLVIFAVCFGETAVGLGLVVPGETIAILGGVYSSPDAHLFIPPGNTPLTLPLVTLAVTLGAVLGDNAGFFLGRRYGRQIVEGKVPRWLVPPERLAMADSYYAQHGGKTVFLGRFIPVVRSMGGLVAGMSQMSWRRFAAFELPGAVLWALAHSILGYLLGRAFFANKDRIESYLTWGGVGIAVLLVAVVWFSRRMARRRREAKGGGGDAERDA